MENPTLIPHLFRSEFANIVAVMARYFGAANVDAAEDVVSETFVHALETWPYKGIPDNPRAWLYTVAKHKALNVIRRDKNFHEKVTEEIRKSNLASEAEIDFSDTNISDSQLQMLFAVCHPAIALDSQVALALRLLCGFGIDEIANAFLTNKDAITKRIYRAKEKLRSEKILIEFPPPPQMSIRIDAVLRTLYLLFSEGYCSESDDSVIREELCIEGIRLTNLLTRSEETNFPAVNALLALMCFHASRLRARKNHGGEIVLYDEQDESLWDQELIARGVYYLHEASQGKAVSKYHLEAAIAWWHTIKKDSQEKWDNILQLYNQLLKVEFSPIAALNRTYALSKVHGNDLAIREAEKLQLNNNQYYFALLGELYKTTDKTASRKNFERALELARTVPARAVITKKMSEL
jgi:RNA polymerase sigma factor (sigma-70 family)